MMLGMRSTIDGFVTFRTVGDATIGQSYNRFGKKPFMWDDLLPGDFIGFVGDQVGFYKKEGDRHYLDFLSLY